MTDGLVTVGSYNTVFEADLVKGELEAFGVDVVMENRNMVNTNWLLSNMLGGVKVRVPEAQADEARRILTADEAEEETDDDDD
ncbi:MAG: DUF2007 domain-containing protein [Candidatus Solibacter sp.]